MSDQALASKAAFGALVLVFCAASYWLRPSHEARGADRTVHVAEAPAAPVALPSPVAPEPAPLDVQEEAAPVRVEVTLRDAQPLPPSVQRTRHRTKLHAPDRKLQPAKTAAPRIHRVVLKRKASPYAVGRKHYPYDPRELHAMRDAP